MTCYALVVTGTGIRIHAADIHYYSQGLLEGTRGKYLVSGWMQVQCVVNRSLGVCVFLS